MREIKFRVWIKSKKVMMYFGTEDENIGWHRFGSYVRKWPEQVTQYIGLKDKNGLQEVYEGDIIDATGNIITNIHEKTHTEKSDFIIQGFGTKDWIATYQGAVARGCKDSE